MKWVTHEVQCSMQFFNFMCGEADEAMVEQCLMLSCDSYRAEMLQLLPDSLRVKLFTPEGVFCAPAITPQLMDEMSAHMAQSWTKFQEAVVGLSADKREIRRHLPKTVRKLFAIPLHDSEIVGVEVLQEGTVDIHLEERDWGKVTFRLTGGARMRLEGIRFPDVWLYDEQDRVGDGYVWRVLGASGSFEVEFQEVQILATAKPYASSILEETDGTMLEIKLLQVVWDKKIFVGRAGLLPWEREVLALHDTMNHVMIGLAVDPFADSPEISPGNRYTDCSPRRRVRMREHMVRMHQDELRAMLREAAAQDEAEACKCDGGEPV